MLKFSQYIIENVEDTARLSHLEHAEDHVINAGEAGVHHAVRTLVGVHHKLLGHNTPVKLTTKYDGAPAIIFGHHPKSGKFFVASKSAFNKTPKINYSHEDVDRNHGHSPGLADKLKTALTHLPKVTPKGRVFQGDLMYTKGDVHSTDTHHSFKPNTIKYSVKKDSPTGKKVERAHVGVAVHTEYKGDDIHSLKAHFAPDTSDFKSHPDAHIIGTHTKANAADYKPKDRVKFFAHIKKAKEAASGHDFGHLDHPVREHVKTYINHTVRTGTTPTIKGLAQHVANKHDAKKALYKTADSKQKVENQKQEHLGHISANKDSFARTLKVHKHLQNAKHVLVKALSKSDEFEHHIDDKPSGPEGHVAIVGSKPTKLVDRGKGGFSAANLTAGGIKKLKESTETVVTGHHGTDANFKKFSLKHSAEGAYFFTADPNHAAKFGKRVITKNIHFQNPHVVHGSTLPKDHRLEDVERLIHHAKNNGHDGVIIKDFNDYGHVSDTYLAFHHSQLKNTK